MTLHPDEQARELAERLAECLIAVLASIYSQKKSFAHPGDEVSEKVTAIILDDVTALLARVRQQTLEEACAALCDPKP